MDKGAQSFWISIFEAIPEEQRFLFAVLVLLAVVLAVIIFRRPLERLIDRLQELGPTGARFGKRLDELQEKVRNNPELEALRPKVPIKPGFWTAFFSPPPKAAPVHNSWDRLNKVVHDALAIHQLQPRPGGKIGDAVERLVSAGMLATGYANVIKDLYDVGKELVDEEGKSSKRRAYAYQQQVDKVAKWLEDNLFQPPSPPPPEAPRRTQVGGYFPSPGPGRASAILVSVAGPMRGKQFPVDKQLFRIGANPENDLVIQGDEFVSGSHAHLRYNQGALFISDQKSRNGTFLNDSRLKEAALTLNPKDRIRIGDCIFEVLPAH